MAYILSSVNCPLMRCVPCVSRSTTGGIALGCDLKTLGWSGRVLRRFPEARRELRQAVARGAAREGVLQLAKGLRWVAMARAAGLCAALPSKAQLGGTHITDRRYRQYVLAQSILSDLTCIAYLLFLLTRASTVPMVSEKTC